MPVSSSGRLPASGRVIAVLLTVAVVAGTAGCGKKGPPLPPLIRIPAAPEDIRAVRRGDEVELSFTVPSANTDGTRPADIERVDLVALTGPRSVSDATILDLGTFVGSIDVKSPEDPDRTVDPDEPLSDLEPLTGSGLDQGSVAQLTERLAPAALQPVALPAMEPEPVEQTLGGEPRLTPVITPSLDVPSRIYVAIGISTRGRRGAISGRAVVPLAPAPPAPGPPEVTYDEQAVTITWLPTGEFPPASTPMLPARVILPPAPETMYAVYEVPPQEEEQSSSVGTRLTEEPVGGQSYVDRRIEWGAERCYAVRVVHRYRDGASLESDPSAPTCLLLSDVFAPPVPTGLQSIASEGAIVLIWNPVTAPDLAGYVILRGEPGGELQPIAAPPVQEATFRDEVPSGRRFAYAVRAVDRAGNASEASEIVEDLAR